jgi:phosphoribosylaminoimidazolecarboxamide formyltransferase/IMP cyclohydrolase
MTGHPEMMEGRVKTLHPAVHAGLLARRDRADDMEALREHGYAPVDLVAVNLYPFRETVARGDVPVGEAMEQVDIGGPTMIRSAAKNHRDVWVLVDPADYGPVVEALDAGGDQAGLRRSLAAKVFRHVSGYDAAVAGFLGGGGEVAADGVGGEDGSASDAGGGPAEAAEASGAGVLPESLHLPLRRLRTLRYGENPDQEAAFYAMDGAEGLAALEKHHGKALSFNNLLDLDGALLSIAPFAFSPRPAVCIVKHTTPCGLAVGETQAEAWDRALRCDPVSAFGSVVALDRPVEEETAERISRLFVECVVAPAFDEAALEILTRKKSIRLLTFPAVEEPLAFEPEDASWTGRDDRLRGAGRFLAAHGRRPHGRVLRSVYGGMLVQTPPLPPFYGVEAEGWTVATERAPTAEELDDLRFAWASVFGVKSNAILLARGGATLGIGAGQMSRVDSSRIAVRKAADQERELSGSVLASDAFFPFRDGVDAAAEAGVRAIVQPGGSIRDEEVVAAADEHGMAMVLTGRRLFRH